MQLFHPRSPTPFLSGREQPFLSASGGRGQEEGPSGGLCPDPEPAQTGPLAEQEQGAEGWAPRRRA